jgi:hypothetical protein
MASKKFKTDNHIIIAEVLGNKITISVRDLDGHNLDQVMCNSQWKSRQLQRQMFEYLYHYGADEILDWLSDHSYAFA